MQIPLGCDSYCCISMPGERLEKAQGRFEIKVRAPYHCAMPLLASILASLDTFFGLLVFLLLVNIFDGDKLSVRVILLACP